MIEKHTVHCTPARTEADLDAVRELFLEYAGSLDFDLGFQGFEAEMAAFPDEYAAPAGCLFLARRAQEPLGCVGLRPFEALNQEPDQGQGGAGRLCEMKRLYVRPAGRGAGAGRLLAEAVVFAARERGYARMRLDTVPSMAAAMGLYRSLGFVEIAAYRHNPVPGTRYFELTL